MVLRKMGNNGKCAHCSNCTQSATRICSLCSANLCNQHNEYHTGDNDECDPDYVLPLINSPRSGVCGYMG